MADEDNEDVIVGDEPNFGDDDAIIDLGDDDLNLLDPVENLGIALDTEREFEE